MFVELNYLVRLIFERLIFLAILLYYPQFYTDGVALAEPLSLINLSHEGIVLDNDRYFKTIVHKLPLAAFFETKADNNQGGIIFNNAFIGDVFFIFEIIVSVLLKLGAVERRNLVPIFIYY